MLYRIVDHPHGSNIAYGVETARTNLPNQAGRVVALYSRIPLTMGEDYSFIPKRFFYRNSYIHATLDFKAINGC